MTMRGIGNVGVLAGVSLCLATAPVLAAGTASVLDPHTETLAALGNGYPGGPHFDVTVVAEAAGFRCSGGELGAGLSGGRIFVPADGRRVRVLVEWTQPGSGRSPGETSVEVVDACTGFTGPDDPATLRLPGQARGYAVFARSGGKPTAPGSGRICDPEISRVAAPDVSVDPLFFLGVVNTEGVFTATDQFFDHPPGRQTTKDITGLFLWSGMMCYPFGPPEARVEIPGPAFTEECCELADGDGDGVPDTVGNCGLEVWDDAVQDETCGAEWLSCLDYSMAETWLFAIPDLLDSVWREAADSPKTLQLRFYPLPLLPRAGVRGGG
jgi:hypothetical protein